MDEDSESDRSLRREFYVFGDEAITKIEEFRVLLIGIGGVGVEIAKNLILAGIYSLTIQDNRFVNINDIGTHFNLTQNDVNRNRAEVLCEKLSKLNPRVKMESLTQDLTVNHKNLFYLSNYDCVILTECQLDIQLKVNNYCRTHLPRPIRFITADVYGFFCWIFNDFGQQFDVIDENGEEEKEIFIGFISKDKPGLVTTLDNIPHGFVSGTTVEFTQIEGMIELNEKIMEIIVLSPSTFTICDTTGEEYGEYVGGGMVTRVKLPKQIKFESLNTQLLNPRIIQYNNANNDNNMHLTIISLYNFWQNEKRLPKLWDDDDTKTMIAIAHQINNEQLNQKFKVNEELIEKLSKSSQSCIIPLNSFVGGIVALETLKSATGKFTPIQQWFTYECSELMDKNINSSQLRNRYSHLNSCLNESVIKKLNDMKLILVGCGAIGCEILKNCALLGIGTKQGFITVIDDDIIEKSNLNNQILFREHQIAQSKIRMAIEAVELINPDINIIGHQLRVCPITANIMSNEMFENADIIVSAIDNIEGRRYLDSLALKFSRPLFDTGLNGTKAHVQIILPHQTETYSSLPDPSDHEVPYCVLKSFPFRIDHAVQWAKEKFEKYFYIKPKSFNEFWSNNTNVTNVLELLKNGEYVNNCGIVGKYLQRRPKNIFDCITLARFMFDKYFNGKAKQLLATFPIDRKLENGARFWHFPKRPPTPIKFNPWIKLHFNFIKYTTILIASIYNIKEKFPENVMNYLLSIPVPDFVPKNKIIETNETAKKVEISITADDPSKCATQIEKNIKDGLKIPQDLIMNPIETRKENIYENFIFCATNLRATMYSIKITDWATVRQINEKIIPISITTTSVVASLATLELIKFASNVNREIHQNHFLNLALPHFVSSEPCQITRIKLGEMNYSIWDKWEIHGNCKFTLKQFIDYLVTKTGLQISMIVDGKLIVYLPFMPGHNNRFSQTMNFLLKADPFKKFTDLSVAFENPEIGDDIMGPIIRYYFN